MKTLLKKIVFRVLKFLAKRRLKKFQGRIIAVTGSVGKTSTKDAIFTVLNSKFKVRKSEGNMNSDFGLLLTILEIESGYSSVTKWSWYLIKAFVHSFFPERSEILLLELGVDKPRDMDFLVSVVKPDIAVMTNIGPTHIDEGQFKNEQQIYEEKIKLVEALKPGGKAVLNLDDKFFAFLAKNRKKESTVTFGTSNESDFKFGPVRYSVEGLRFNVIYGDDKVRVEGGAVGDHQAYILTPAMVCGVLMGMDMGACAQALKRYKQPPGRMTLIPGIKDSVILDSTYNSSPKSLRAALETLKKIEHKGRKVAVLGNMNELGDRSDELHREAGGYVGKCCDFLVLVGASAKLIGEEALEKGLGEKNMEYFSNTKEAIEGFEKLIKKGDLILVKGSQNQVRLERLVQEIMLHPEEAGDLLVRQGKVWEAKL